MPKEGLFTEETLQSRHAATRCKTLQITATRSNTVQHTATHCNTLQHTATHRFRKELYPARAFPHRDLLQCVAVRWSVVQRVVRSRESTGNVWDFSESVRCVAYMRCGVSQCVAVCCSGCAWLTLFQHAATLYKAQQHTATHCYTLLHTTTHYNTLHQHTNTLQRTATHCNRLQHTATYCNTSQYTATHCNTLQHMMVHPTKAVVCMQHMYPPCRACIRSTWDVYVYSVLQCVAVCQFETSTQNLWNR